MKTEALHRYPLHYAIAQSQDLKWMDRQASKADPHRSRQEVPGQTYSRYISVAEDKGIQDTMSHVQPMSKERTKV